MKCPKCGYVRETGEKVPDYECPNCGVIYAKFEESERRNAALALEAKARAEQAEKRAAESAQRKEAAAQRAAELPPKTLICSGCGAIGEVTSYTPGSILIEIILWFCLLVPGLIYTIWRHSARHRVCARCGHKHLMPVGTPMGMKLLADVAPHLKIRKS